MVDFLQPGKSTIQDLTLLLFSAIFYLLIVLDAFWHENGFQLLGTMVIGALNLLQSIVYAVGPCNENETSTSFQFFDFFTPGCLTVHLNHCCWRRDLDYF